MSEPIKYRKKPVVVEAVCWPSQYAPVLRSEALAILFRWRDELQLSERTIRTEGDYLIIGTLEGEMVANPGDFIIKGIAGEFYPCKPDIFHQTYEEVVDEIE